MCNCAKRCKAARRRLFLWLVKQTGVDSRPRFRLVLVDLDPCSYELTTHTDSLWHCGHLVQNEFKHFFSLALDLPYVCCREHLGTAGCRRQGRINVRIRNKYSSHLNHTDMAFNMPSYYNTPGILLNAESSYLPQASQASSQPL